MAENQTFDIDSLEIDLLIICKNPAAFQQSASYLTRRGWPTTVVGSLNRAIDQVMKTNPDFVLISFNHANPALFKLPHILSTSFNIPVIGFVETNDASGVARLQTSGLQHKLGGLPSGPNIERFVRRILLDLYAPKPDPQARTTGDASASPSMQVISGGAASGSALNIIPGNLKTASDIDKLDAGTYTMSTKRKQKLKHIKNTEQEKANKPNREDVKITEKDFLKLLGVDPNREPRGESGMMFMPSKDEGKDGPEAIIQNGPGSKSGGGGFQLKTSPMEEESEALRKAERPLGRELQAQKGVVESPEHSVQQEGISSPELSARTGQQTPEGDYILPESSSPAREKGFKHKPGPERKPGMIVHPLRQARVSDPLESILETALNQSLPKVCDHKKEIDFNVSRVSTLGVISIDSQVLHGYLLVCASNSDVLDLQFLNELRTTLIESIKAEVPRIRMDDAFVISVDSFEYHEWVARATPLSLLTQHKGVELGISFLATDFRLHDPQDRGGMASIPVEEISPEHPVTFKAYLHFERNDRYFLYLRNGRKLIKKQKDKLLGKRIKEFYIKAIDLKNYRIYSAGNFISDELKKKKSA